MLFYSAHFIIGQSFNPDVIVNKKPLIFLWSVLQAFSISYSASESSVWTDVAEADRLLMGDYEGEWLNPPEDSYQFINPKVTAQIANIDVGSYKIHFVQDLNRRADKYFEGEGKLVGKKIVFDQRGWKISASKKGLKGTARIGEHAIKFSLKRVERLSPTIGAKAPEGAVQLFDGSSFEEWRHSDGRAVTWKLVGDGAMEIEPKNEHKGADPMIGGGIATKRKFEDVIYHMEFRYPVEPGKVGQKRGNSGLYFQGYEVQILNSYALGGMWNELGALYKLSPPQVNAARPPMQWQTYDVTYRSPRYKDGKLTENARITVVLNGATIQKDVELIHRTAHKEQDRWKPAPTKPGSISLQDHSNRIQFRNIWAKAVQLD